MVSVEGSLSAETIAQQSFGPARRGFDPEQVRAFLVKVASEVVALQQRQNALEEARRDAEYRAAHPSFDEDTLLGAVGEETRLILKSAHDAAADIKNRAGESASRILKDAHQQAEALRADAEAVLSKRTEEAERIAAGIKETGRAEAERLVDQARQQSKAVRAQAEAERNAMVEAAQLTRDKILSALTRKRNVAIAQVEALRAGRERLLEAYSHVKQTLDDVTADLTRAETEARAAADAVRHRPVALDELDGLDDPEPTNPTLPIIQVSKRPRDLAGAAPVPSAQPPTTAASGPPLQRGAAAAQPARLPGAGAPHSSALPAAVNAGTTPRRTDAASSSPPLVPATVTPPPGANLPPTGSTGKSTPTKPAETAPVPAPTSGSGPGPKAEPALAPAAGSASALPAAPGEPATTTVESAAEAESTRPPAKSASSATPAGSASPGAPTKPEVSVPPAGSERSVPVGGSASLAAPKPLAAPAASPADDGISRRGTNGAASSPEQSAPPPQSKPGDTVDSLFARIREDREKAVTHAREVLAEDQTAPARPAADGSAGGDQLAGESVDRAPVEAERPIPDDDESRLQRRDQILGPIDANLTRRLKRALQDDQNDLLDHLRSLRAHQKPATVLPSREAHANRFREVGRPFLEEALAGGATFTSLLIPGPRVAEPLPDATPFADDLVSAIVDPLRKRLLSVLEAGEGDDPILLAEAVGGAYREWKTKRVEVTSADHVATAFAAGAFGAAPAGTPLSWLVDDPQGPCPDCDDNALAGAQPKGEPFPTGQEHPPAHPGCRCVLIPELP